MDQASRARWARKRNGIGSVVASATVLLGVAGSALVPGVANAASDHTAKSVVVSTVKNAKLGTLLVSGKTLYTLKASKTACSTSCLKAWPELVLPKGVKKATAGSGVSASKLGTIARSGGVLQVTYGGKPLYTFVGDKSAGAVNGNVTDTWGSWSDVVTAKPSSGQVTTTTSAGTGGVAF